VVHLDDLASLSGQSLGFSAWRKVTQEQVNQFAELTGDLQWIHTDPERARSGPFRGTVSFGFFTLALFTVMLEELLTVEGASLIVNYGTNRVRFPAPVPVGSSIRGGIEVVSVEEVPGGVHAEFRATVEMADAPKPGCVADVLFRYYREVPGAA
jgi:acyl dehydratase